ncbi:UDP-3-O-[3-hydroxymyristoyl] N-acetylglucosamine deacetylase [Litorimonas taeanensis]|uniref:UDP-3-O-acyl-N-acetylglucosamine deacetylase n=1 Tax=Litorimonas taeanensis TaxID=568099 RepID=A0A420WLC2_9PROT|nr:UDP-3-O-acyl-N-acetylglucosamine deacetylase [Litorimonas taeanensis]RKQ71706.1 UDP-3-O-[3-hydroxymyristoyl] N-acetylglucosamine deacetylase [Litorimonas taeanensis]
MTMLNVRRQSTLKAPAVCAGIELHGGNHTRLVMRPAPIGTGLVFIRTDIKDRDNRIKVIPESVCNVRNCTTIANAAGVTVSTIEHLLAALAAAGIDNLYLELDGKELPALDGSAEPFLKLIEQVGVLRQEAARRYVEVLKPIEVKRGDAYARILPASKLSLSVSIDFEDEAIGQQKVEIVPNVRAFRERIAAARTFARLHEVAALQAAGLSKGGSFDNAIIVDGDKVLNPEGLRFADEFVRHKALDLLGDLYLGGPILGRVETHASGHGLNHDLLMTLFAHADAWRFVSLMEKSGKTSPETLSSAPDLLQSMSA